MADTRSQSAQLQPHDARQILAELSWERYQTARSMMSEREAFLDTIRVLLEQQDATWLSRLQ